MDVYVVGGAVRDELLNREVADKDYLVVGSSTAEMLGRGFVQVGADFPVFLHPETRDEYALARIERKQGQGYLGFAVETEAVTLEEDLSRRDLTVNAMARNQTGQLCDPFGGQQDLADRVLRHVSPAFSEDPIRVLRIGRFLARYGADWAVATETMELIREMVQKGELDSLNQERIWKELSRGLMEDHPQLMLEFFETLGLFSLSSFNGYVPRKNESARVALTAAVNAQAGLEARLGIAFSALTLKTKVPTICQEICDRVTKLAASGVNRGIENRFNTLEYLDAFRQKKRTSHVVEALSYLHRDLATVVHNDLTAASAVDISAIAARMTPGPEVAKAIRAARLSALV